jgi:hypothetical protein
LAFTISNFLSELGKNGYLRTHSFDVVLGIPTALAGQTISGTAANTSSPVNDVNRILTLRAEEARTPVATIVTADIPRYSIGPTQKQPVTAQFQDTWFSIICDKYGKVWNFWNAWLNMVFSFSPAYTGSGTHSQYPSYTAKYKDEYATQIMLNLYDQTGNMPIQFLFNDAFPIQMKEVSLGWAEQGELVRLSIAFTYKDYSITGSNLSSGSSINPAFSPTPVSAPSRSPLPMA